MPTADDTFMIRAIELAQRGQGSVEPNPMVGCVLTRDDTIIGEGWHKSFGGPHAEINALGSLPHVNGVSETPGNTTAQTSGATAYVTLEPCSHTGKTGPCSLALIQAKFTRVVVAVEDPNPIVAGAGIQQLRDAGIEVIVGVQADAAKDLLAPYLKKMNSHQPWIIAKWAMTQDGRIATSTGNSKWISNKSSRATVHQIRGRVDGVMVGIGTALADDPMLNPRPAGVRNPTRIVVDSTARISVDSKLVKTANEFPTLIAVGPSADAGRCEVLTQAGVEVFRSDASDANQRLIDLLAFLAEKGMTNILVEGGGELLGSLHDLGQIDETHVFIGSKMIGGAGSISPIAGLGQPSMADATALELRDVQRLGSDVYVISRARR